MGLGIEEREWKLRDPSCQDAPSLQQKFSSLQKETGLSPLTVRVCMQRGMDDAESIRNFLFPKFELLTHPSKIRDMDRALDRLVEARAKNEWVRVFGDYDVDGTAGSALMSWVLREYGFRFDVRQPDRFKDGYGLNVAAVKDVAEAGARVLVTVDCGITSFEAAEKAKELGVDLIVLDHHQLDPARGLPPAFAVVNPQRPDCQSGLKQLCGCGLAFYLAMGLRIRGRQEGWFAQGYEPNLKQHLDLVVMATAADMVPLTGDNHVLVRHGLEVLKKTRKPGVKALLEAAGLSSRDVSPGHLGFVIGPRINASGRIRSASLALELLTTEDAERAVELARELETLNAERARIQNEIWDQVRKRVEDGISEGRFRHGIVVADPGWHEGVVGIVASRVTEMFRRPAAVIALREGVGKGSVRSFAGKDVLSALRDSSSHLLGFGGHRHAAGISVASDQIASFSESFDEALSKVQEDEAAKPLLIEGVCSIRDLDLHAIQELERLGPFGPGNPEPVFVFRASVQGHQILKGRHLKLNLAAQDDSVLSKIEAIWFHAAEREEMMAALTVENESEWAGVPEVNRFRGRSTPTFRVRNWRKIPEAH